jgi:hypothetical protein
MNSMKSLSFGLVLGIAAATAFAEDPVVQNYSFSDGFQNGGAIPDGSSIGWSDTRLIDDWGSGLSIADVSVTLHIVGGYNGDFYAYLTHDTGFAVLLNRVGRTESDAFGYADPGVNVTLWDGAATDIHLYGGNGGLLLTGAWQPDGRNVNPGIVTDASTRGAMLSTFNGLSPNGEWTLFISDLSIGGGEALLQNWSLEIAAVPEPSVWALGALGLGLVMLIGRARRF